MSIAYPITPPSTGIQRISPAPVDVVADDPSPYTGQNDVQVFPGQWWEFVITLRAFKSRADAMPWTTFIKKLKGKTGTFLFGDPLGASPRGVGTGTPLVDGGGQSGGVLNTKGWTANITGILLEGDYIQLGAGADTRLYQLLEDADSDALGKAALKTWPNIRGDKIPADNDPVVIANAKGVFRLKINVVPHDITAPTVYSGISFPIREAI